jgi:hypothetical protein
VRARPTATPRCIPLTSSTKHYDILGGQRSLLAHGMSADSLTGPSLFSRLLLIFLRWSVYHRTMNSGDARQDRPDIVAATRGGDNSLGLDDEADPETASLEQALFWRSIYTEILAMEEAVLERIRQLMAGQSPQARREVELTNVPVVVAQVERFRSRRGIWDALVHAYQQ